MIPLLNIEEPLTSASQSVTVERTRAARKEWINYYERGGRLARVSWGKGTMAMAYMTSRPIESGRTLSVQLDPLRVGEVWSHTPRVYLSGIFVETMGKLFEAHAMNGWRFRKPDWMPGIINFRKPSPEAIAIIDKHAKLE